MVTPDPLVLTKQLQKLQKVKNPSKAQQAQISTLLQELLVAQNDPNNASNSTSTIAQQTQQLNGLTAGSATGLLPTGASVSNFNSATVNVGNDKSNVFGFKFSAGSVGANGVRTMTGSEWNQAIINQQSNKSQIAMVQMYLQDAGLLSKSHTVDGDLDAATKSAWETLGKNATGAISASVLLAAGKQDPNLVSELTDVNKSITSAQAQAAAVTNSNVTLTDPNKIAQTAATAWESMGLGAPPQGWVDKFVSGFHAAEVNATVDEANAAKQNLIASAGNLEKARQDVIGGNMNAAAADRLQAGPTTVATKTAPNLDAEAIAAAQQANPAQYAATGASYLYGQLVNMLNGNPSNQTSPASPTSLTPAGAAVVTTPMAGL